MSLCHLYYSSSTSHHIKEILEYFKSDISLDINAYNEIDDYDVYIVELEETNKEISAKLVHLFKQKNNSLVYFLVPNKYNLMFFQLSYLLNAKNLITQNMDTTKAIERIIEDEKTFKEELYQRVIANTSVENQNFIIYKNMDLEKASNKLLRDFGCKTLESFQNSILNQLDINTLLSKDSEIEKSISINGGIAKKYTFTSVSVASDIKIIYIEELSTKNENIIDLVSSRISFVEHLKEKLIQKDIVNNGLHAVTINMLNIEKLQKELSVLSVEELLIDLLRFVRSTVEKKVLIGELAIGFYIILFEATLDDEVEKLANEIHTKIINYISTLQYSPVLDMYVVNLGNFELGDILSTLGNIMKVTLTPEEDNSTEIKHIRNSQIIDEKTLLEDAFKYSSEMKILNIYHGLVINTSSKILAVNRDTITISFEALQGVVIDIEKRTILQSPVFPHDIEAKVKKIDLARKIVMLEKFRFLKTNINSRRYSRVTTSNKTPISLSVDGVNLNGFILDLSIKSIALHVRYSNIIDTIKDKDIVLTFNLPDSNAELGYSRVDLEGKVIAVITENVHHTGKIVCDIDEYNTHDSILIQYIYKRQKELILELKKIAQLH